jgi:hypothetical protein
LLGHRKKIAKFSMRTFTCLSSSSMGRRLRYSVSYNKVHLTPLGNDATGLSVLLLLIIILFELLIYHTKKEICFPYFVQLPNPWLGSAVLPTLCRTFRQSRRKNSAAEE